MNVSSATEIVYLSQTAPVSMGDAWFEIASLSHFWIQRRFDVLRRMTRGLKWQGLSVAEIGCGNGLLQRQCEDAFGISVDGFDLNEFALQQNLSRRSRVFCYNISDKLDHLQGKYDFVLLFDVLEHIANEAAFLQEVQFHIKKGGTLIVNVPADQSLFSAYDRAAGHVRRYSGEQLRQVLDQSGLSAATWTYWGLPLIPSLVARKILLHKRISDKEILEAGFRPPSSIINWLLGAVSRCERIPQHMNGSSVMMLATRH